MKSILNVNKLDLDEATLSLHETLFHNANGYIGVRGTFEEGYIAGRDTMRGIYLNGVYDIAPMKQAEQLCNFVEEKETMLNVADTQTIYVSFDSEIFSLFQGTTKEYSRALDIQGGYTSRTIKWTSPTGKEALIEIRRMTSFVKLPLFVIEYKITPLNFDGKVTFTSVHNAAVKNYCNPKDPRMAAESPNYLNAGKLSIENGKSYITSVTTKSGLTICSGVGHELNTDADVTVDIADDNRCVTHTIACDGVKGQTIELIKYSIFEDSVRETNPMDTAKSDMLEVMEKGYKFYFDKQREYLKKFWSQTELEIQGDDELNDAVTFNMYQLLQSAAKDGYCSIAAKGLSGEGYEGHYFWDTEMYMLPFFTLTNPELSRELLRYRYGTLDKARENARLLGHDKGALFPWRTITGVECSGYYVSGSAQYHINGDIAYSVITYYLATKDVEFMAECGAEILIETARLWFNVGNYSDGRFNINDVTGPDEYTCIVNNNYFTNCCAKKNMEWAVKIFEILKAAGMSDELAGKINVTEEELKAFAEAADKMYLPYDEKLGINPQDDSFLQKPVWDLENTPKDKFPLLLHYHPLFIYRHQVVKQADTVLAHFLFEENQSIETIKNSFEYYEKITTHDSSLSTCIYSIVASKLGLYDKAYYYFGDSAKMDLLNTHHNTKDGIHTANMGGCYMAIIYGFAGVRIKEEGVSLYPYIPEKWSSYTFKIMYTGVEILVKVSKDEIEITAEGGSVELNVYDNNYTVNDGETVKIANIANK